MSKELEQFRRLDEELPPLEGMEEPPVTQEARKSSMREAAMNLNNSLCLVEAVAVSPKFAVILSQRRRALLRVLFTVGSLKVPRCFVLVLFTCTIAVTSRYSLPAFVHCALLSLNLSTPAQCAPRCALQPERRPRPCSSLTNPELSMPVCVCCPVFRV